jgi:threonine dehydratase
MSEVPVSEDLPDFHEVQLAAARIRSFVRETPVLNDAALDQTLGCCLFFKCENLQYSGAFKLRGASNAVARLREQNISGDVATHSSGNHGAALALAARLDGRRAHVVMPENASPFKVSAVREQGGIVHFCKANQMSREQGLEALVGQGHIAIPPYDHVDIIAGQGTACLELLQQIPGLQTVVVPVGGGGLIAGTALVTGHYGLSCLGAEPSGAADTAISMERGHRVEEVQADTIADGLRALVGVRNFALIQQGVDAVITVTDDEIRQAMIDVWRYFRLLIEPSSAVVLAAAQKQPDRFRGKKVAAIISGGNITPQGWLEITGFEVAA